MRGLPGFGCRLSCGSEAEGDDGEAVVLRFEVTMKEDEVSVLE